MADNQKLREREREPGVETNYDVFIRSRREFDERQRNGPIVIKPSDREYQQTRQGRLFYFLNAQAHKDTPLHDWRVFVHDIKTHSGMHRHQGGFVIYVIEGKGYSMVDGERVDWGPRDLLLLPIKPAGVEHQHFNLEPGKPCRWIAFCYLPVFDHLASEFTQMQVSPQFTG
ncbi:MAG: cupin domain-containing protein [Betaproteobacteria bacterium]|nr:cupin domain-containing protein [Betaproteobacteria bacterium]